jgi:hypothetical protein
MSISYPTLKIAQFSSEPPSSGVGLLTPPSPLMGEGSAKLLFSSSLDGISSGTPKYVPSSADSVTYTNLHTFSYGVVEELYIWCSNPSGGNANLTMSVEDTAAPSFSTNTNIIVQITAQNGLNLVYPGIIHQGNSTSTRSMFLRASAQNSLNVSGFVVRSYPFPGKSPETYGYYNSDAGD